MESEQVPYGERALAKLRELVADCKTQQALLGKEDVSMVYVLPGNSWVEGKRRRLWQRNGPLGNPVGIVKGGVAVMFRAPDVIAAAETQIARYTLLKSVVEEADDGN
jgi:hypothetical protein